jgi:pimeloyl-ACP methyl ester carboxylesterase
MAMISLHGSYLEELEMSTRRPAIRTKGQRPPGVSDALNIPSQWLRLKGLDIHYKCLGEGPPVILIHGHGNDWHEWRENIPRIALSRQVYALDMPGFGLSQPYDLPLSVPWSVAFLADFMGLVEIPQASLVGHSLGGLVALSFALRYPERVLKLALVDSAGLGEMDIKARLYLPLLRGLERVISGKKYPRISHMSSQDRSSLARQLPGLKPDTMIIWGRNDRYLHVSHGELAHLLIPNSTLHIFPGCGHAPQRESPEEFNHLICQFLGRSDIPQDHQDILGLFSEPEICH